MATYVVVRHPRGLYNFERIDQSGRYVRVCNILCREDTRAIRQARRIIGPRFNPKTDTINIVDAGKA